MCREKNDLESCLQIMRASVGVVDAMMHPGSHNSDMEESLVAALPDPDAADCFPKLTEEFVVMRGSDTRPIISPWALLCALVDTDAGGRGCAAPNPAHPLTQRGGSKETIWRMWLKNHQHWHFRTRLVDWGFQIGEQISWQNISHTSLRALPHPRAICFLLSCGEAFQCDHSRKKNWLH